MLRRAAHIVRRLSRITPNKVLFFGDSITAYGSGFSGMFTTDHPRLSCSTNAASGSGFLTGSTSADWFMTRQAAALATNPEVLVLLAGANDLSDSATYPTTQDWLNQLYKFTDPFRAQGCKVILIPPLPQGSGYPGNATHNARRVDVRTQMLLDVGSRNDGVIDHNSPDSAANDVARYADGLHPTDAEHLTLYTTYIRGDIRVKGLGMGAFHPREWIYPNGGQDGIILDISDITTLFTDTAGTTQVSASGDAIARINDLSGYGYNLTQSTSGNRPTYRTNGGAGGVSPYADFDGSNDYMQTATLSSKAQPNFQMLGAKVDSTAATIVITDGLTTGNRGCLINVAGGDFFLQAGSGVDSGLNLTTSDAVMGGTFNGSASVGYLDSTAGSSVLAGSNPMTGVTLGAGFTIANFWDGRVYRFVQGFSWNPNSRIRAQIITWCAAGQGRTL